ncbi:60S acidic ribosomal protein P2 [Camponotus floridanus]|uniref:Large ribosomal subunit protein P2 n=2 Tax=Camponotus floridanus TaxID=104421 RepID=E2AYQ2_CAMFO|nr:60S acidic ribosomal protein P2 [Camponotus floridanus]
MRALSFSRDSFYHRNMNIKKSLNFDSSPSPQKYNFNTSSPIDSMTDASSPMLDKSLRLDSSSNDSVASSMLVASLESIDENQNQTPQQNRKIVKISNNSRINTRETDESGSSCSTSSLRSNLREKIDNIVRASQTPDLQSFNQKNKSRALGCIIVASTPRNLSQELNQDAHNRSHTPDNMMHLIPESMSAIKKSHKKEKLYGHEERLFTQQKNISAQNEDTYTSLESIAMDTSAIASCSRASIKESPKKNKSVKKALIYYSDDELSETESVFKHGTQRKAKLRKKNLLGNRLDKVKNDKIQDIQHRDNTHFTNYDDKKDHSMENICDKNTCRPSSQKELSTCNANMMDKNRAVSPKPDSTIPQDSGIATPENNINIIEHLLTESIKKSHKKIKHENRKTSLKAKTLYQKIETAQLEVSVQDTSNDIQCEDVEAVVETCALSSQNADRPSTPENINSSRLLLPEFKSVKKSHKKDKYSKRISGLAKCHKYHHEYRKKYDNSLLDNKYEEKNTSKTSHGNESLELNEFLDMSPKKKKKSINVSFESGARKLLYSSKSLGQNDTNDEFKICTPTTHRKITTNQSVINHHVCADEILQEEDKSAENISKEIDCSRCMTPIARCLKKSRESKDLTCIKKIETDASTSSDGPDVDVADSKDENGRSTPINMSTTELLSNIDSIKKSHKKDKHSRSVCKRPVLWKENSHTEENESVNITSMNKLKQNMSLKHMDNDCAKTGMCSNEEEKNKCYEEIIYDDPQPSTSQVRNNIDSKTVKKLELNTTPPNDLNATNFIKLLHTISIKKSHKKERDCNAQAKMRYVAAYMLAVLGGKASPSQNDIEKILSSVGIETDAEKLKKVISELNGKSIDELVAKGREKLSSMPVGGAAAAGAAAAPASGAAAPVEEKKEEKKPAKEESESEDDDMGFGLFD